ncbi:nuclear transport factor 2 family protein [Paraburkholderia sp. BR14374]|uniref:nuclear transport factor 2 family protein n=1 Tax=Paraburkholderia sp. BR14374 TaxID=3237007 RepID=UPI0034CEE4EA
MKRSLLKDKHEPKQFAHTSRNYGSHGNRGAYLQNMRSLDRMLLDELREIFHDDSVVNVGGLFKGTGDQAAVHASRFLSAYESTHHQLGQMSIHLEGHSAHGESYFTAYHKVIRDGVSNDLVVAGSYKDRYESMDGASHPALSSPTGPALAQLHKGSWMILESLPAQGVNSANFGII